MSRLTKSQAKQFFAQSLTMWKQRNAKDWRITPDEAVRKHYPCLAV